MRRFLVVACLLANSAYGAPQRGVQLGGGGSRPVTYGSPQAPQQPNYGPNYSQQLTFGPADAGIRSTSPGAYRSPQPILLQQRSPSTPAPFPSFQSASPFPSGGPSRGPIRGPSTPSPNDDEYEEYDDDDEPPKSQIQQRPIQRAPARVSQPNSFSQGPQRLIVPQSQPQQQAPVRQRQSTPQRGPPPQQYSPQPQTPRAQVSAAPQQQQSRGQQVPSYGLDGKRTRLTTPPPVQTLNRYMKNNEDGSITWGYENEDGTFKEETIGADCVVRGKYGYVDPDGQKREYEYQSGNPCDPNKKDQEEEEEEAAAAAERERPGQQQQLQGVIHASRPRPAQQQRRPVPQQSQQQYAQPQYA